MNQSGFSMVSLLFIIPLLMASVLFMFNINHKLDETLLLTNACDQTVRPALIKIQESTNRIIDLNPSIKVLNALEAATKAAIIAATATANLFLLPELIQTLEQIQKSQKIVKALQTNLIKMLKIQIIVLNQKVRVQFYNRLRVDSRASKMLFDGKSTSIKYQFPTSHHLQKKNSKQFLSEMELSQNYSKAMLGKIEFGIQYQGQSRFQKWFKVVNETKGVCAWSIQEKSGRAGPVLMNEGKY